MQKECFKCFEVKDLKEFYAHKEMADGHLNKCKSCTKSDVQVHRSKNLERIQDYDRNRPNQDERKEAVKKQYKARISTPEGRRREWDKQAEYVRRNRLQRNARIAVGNAIYRSEISKDGAKCERCGTTKHLHAHHEDYYKPLEINWLCRACHGIRHQEINHERRKPSC